MYIAKYPAVAQCGLVHRELEIYTIYTAYSEYPAVGAVWRRCLKRGLWWGNLRESWEERGRRVEKYLTIASQPHHDLTIITVKNRGKGCQTGPKPTRIRPKSSKIFLFLSVICHTFGCS